jgi:hypothetical protein
MADALVAVDEGMILDQCETQGDGLRRDRGIKVLAVEGHAWLSDRRLQAVAVADALATAGLGRDHSMQLRDLIRR